VTAPLELLRRGGDLAVTYADRPQQAMRAQIYWRAASHERRGAIAAVELVVSVETSLLDSNPSIAASSHVPAEESLALVDPRSGTFARVADLTAHGTPTNQPAGYLLRVPGGKLSYAEIVHPGDAHASDCAIAQQGTHRLGHRLFAARLEKGVILRARVLGLVLDRSGDENAVIEHYAAFEASALPLTT
jgi:hypothetical protein